MKDFDIYKIFVDSAEKMSDRRILQNNIYTTINLGLLSFLSIGDIDNKYFYIMCSIAIVLCLIWLITIDNYAKRNKVKYTIINEYEVENKINWFYEENKRISVLSNLTFLEKVLPCLLIGIYFVLIFIK